MILAILKLPFRVARRLKQFVVSRMWWRIFLYDVNRFRKYSGSFNRVTDTVLAARITMAYHVLEKGLTMPNRRMGFGKDTVKDLIALITTYESRFGDKNSQVLHAAACIVAYWELHAEMKDLMQEEPEFWQALQAFVETRQEKAAVMLAFSREEFFSKNEASFPDFAHSRHTSRYFSGSVEMEFIRKAVALAMTAPSACNRQYVRVHCVADHAMRDQILALQNGNRGFGCDADKLLVVTADIAGLRWHEERNDIFTNAGIFIMNLSYALHYYQLGSCILNWSVSSKKDLAAREILSLSASETLVALLAVGPLPDTVAVAASPRKPLEEVLIEHG